MSWHCETWENEMLYRLQYRDDEDEKYARGMYDMAIDIATGIERELGRDFENSEIDRVVEIIYNAIKHGAGVE